MSRQDRSARLSAGRAEPRAPSGAEIAVREVAFFRGMDPEERLLWSADKPTVGVLRTRTAVVTVRRATGGAA